MCSRASFFDTGMSRSAAASWYQFDKQFLQKPARFIRSTFWTSVRARRCSSSLRKAAASKSVSFFVSRLLILPLLPGRGPVEIDFVVKYPAEFVPPSQCGQVNTLQQEKQFNSGSSAC